MLTNYTHPGIDFAKPASRKKKRIIRPPGFEVSNKPENWFTIKSDLPKLAHIATHFLDINQEKKEDGRISAAFICELCKKAIPLQQKKNRC